MCVMLLGRNNRACPHLKEARHCTDLPTCGSGCVNVRDRLVDNCEYVSHHVATAAGTVLR
jgi:hypothetical protein